MITDLYCDGGVMGRNPSPLGGTWAWCKVADDVRMDSHCGVVFPEPLGLSAISSCLAEFYAALMGLLSLPPGWAGRINTDSQVTLYRLEKRGPDRKAVRMAGIPDPLIARLDQAKAALGPYSLRLLGGHPTKANLAAGRTARGLPCSEHNVFCDRLCAERSAWYRQQVCRDY